ncbi:peptide chain release factor 3 [Heliobacterium gestii]|uniref:Peptide chain release factor 3 n=1 Tax=Heliomicrobium gestii TaxID=2699 RepID=A0A845LCG3_HELGE|nr:peptide chain release factor 3 [Heliomicrobium gestii]MBM7866063.1 peptide chain release factor 3 [Heliomicrobium gestii]MZP42610.1 peptide chain release factor 3 [Heliomicrobium gestii]
MSTTATELQTEVQRRRTFAIISHPDAGKTTLTEKLLLYGGAIRLAGTVKARKAAKHAVSDWMEIEKQRGISVTSSVLQFDYDGYRVNILDTPGHQDFSEDTYRTLMATDSAVMVIDVAKGVEDQTKKLFHVCRQRGIPIFTFVNKLDRHGKSPFELMEEIENVLGIRAYPMNWPVGVDGDYKGVYNRRLAQIELFDNGGAHGQWVMPSTIGSAEDPAFTELLGADAHNQLIEDIELLDMAGDQFDIEKVLQGELTPMFFGSALTNFGVRPFLEEFLQLAPPPLARRSVDGLVAPDDEGFTAFVFKIQANMNPTHRDRIAFIRICSGKFARGMSVKHVPSGKSVKLAQPQQFMAQERVIIDEAYPGDVIGLFDPGVFGIGDTLCMEGKNFQFEDFPVFPPEHFARVQPKDTMKRKQFVKGMTQLTQEGAVQVFRQPEIGVESFIVGAVGVLQMEVLEYRLKQEYGVDILMQHLAFSVARWLDGYDPAKPVKGLDSGMLIRDGKERPVALFRNEWSVRWAVEQNPQIRFLTVPER